MCLSTSFTIENDMLPKRSPNLDKLHRGRGWLWTVDHDSGKLTTKNRRSGLNLRGQRRLILHGRWNGNNLEEWS